MEQSDNKGQEAKNIYELKTFPVPFALEEIKENISISTFTPAKPSKAQIIKKAFKFHSQGNIREAAKLYQYFIDQGFNDHSIFANYGIILKNLGKSKEAELYTRKAIELAPDFANGYSNLGNILRDIGNLQESELSTRKAIELNPNLAEAHSNLGNVLRDLGKLEEAECSARIAIQINPNLAEAHSNLGTIYRDLGKLEEAECSARIAIELNPHCADAHFNLGNTLIDLGKFNELILLSKSTLESRVINEGYKLSALLRVTIANLLQRNFSLTFLYMNQTNDLISKGVVNIIKDKKVRKYTSTFSKFITSLYPLLEKDINNSYSEKIPHFGESHCLSFAHQTISIASKSRTIQPVLITGGKAWHFANNKSNTWKDSLTQQIKNHNYSDKVFISFGEIDCRKDEGILTYSISKDKDFLEVCEKTIKGYLDYMEKILSQNYSKKYYFGVAAPTKKKELLDELDKKRIEIIKNYNSILKKEVLSRGSYFLDVYALTSTKTGENNNLHMCDNTHLSPKCLSILFENHLYKTENFIK